MDWSLGSADAKYYTQNACTTGSYCIHRELYSIHRELYSISCDTSSSKEGGKESIYN